MHRSISSVLLACPLLAALCALSAAAHADDGPSLEVPSAHARLGIERVRFGGDSERVGLVGASYLVDVGGLPGFSLGPALYGAATGQRGGFFSLGGEAAWRQRVLGPVGVELGVYAGGGGGGGASRGNGLMVRPHADLSGISAASPSASRSRTFASRTARSTAPSSASSSTPATTSASSRPPVSTSRRSPAAVPASASIASKLVAGVYRTPSGRLLEDGEPLPRTISTLGVRAEQSWGEHGLWGIEANRAARGGVGGYAEVLGTVGVEDEVVRNGLTLGGRIGLGAGGGGGVSTGGGLLVKAALYGIVRLTGDLGLSLEAGATRAPNGNFRALQGSAALVWALDSPDSAGTPVRASRTDFSAGVVGHDAPHVAGGNAPSLRAVTLKIDRYLTSGLYISGEAFGAAGGDAGGYSGALIGAGWNQRFASRFHAGAESLAGASGGGGVDSGGALLQPRVFAGVQITPALAARVGVGRVRATRGALDATLVDASLVFSYGVSGN